MENGATDEQKLAIGAVVVAIKMSQELKELIDSDYGVKKYLESLLIKFSALTRQITSLDEVAQRHAKYCAM
jgi:hypothetical protein